MNPEERIGRMLREATPRSFGPGFAGRVMNRIGLEAELQRYFFRLVPVALAAAVVLAALNLRQAGRGQPRIDAILGLPAVTIAAAYELEDRQ